MLDKKIIKYFILADFQLEYVKFTVTILALWIWDKDIIDSWYKVNIYAWRGKIWRGL